ncbi:MAG: glycosyltransferase family 4 protein [Acidiferrobacterales bacterium]
MIDAQMSVVQILPALEGGGVERGTLEVAAELVRCGHRSIVISGGGRLVDELVCGGSEHISWPVGRKSLFSLRFVSRLRNFLHEQHVDILHARSRLPAWLAYLAWRGMDPALRPHLVTTVHGMYSVSRYSAVMTRGERVIAVSDAVKEYVLQNYAMPAGRLRVIHRGIDPGAFPYGYRAPESWRREWYGQYPFLSDQFVLALPGRITRRKGHADFIRLVSRLRACGYPARGLIVGAEDPRHAAYAEELRILARASGPQLITFAGERSDLREIYTVSDLVLSLSTRPESFGRTVLEALSLGIPVVGYRHGGVGEVLDTIFPAGAVPPGDAGALEAKVVGFMRSRPKVPVSQPFSLDRMLDQTLELYRELRAGRA